jgi:hypothetical protein
MVRPRLVQQGIPLYGPGSEAVHRHDGDSDHSMGDEYHVDNSTEMATTNSTGVSSLQRAAAATSSGRSKLSTTTIKARATEYVIGGTAASAATPTSSDLNSVSRAPSHHQNQRSHTIASSHPQQNHHQYAHTINMAPHEHPNSYNSMDHQNHHHESSMSMEAEQMSQHHENYQINNSHHYPSHPNPSPHVGMNHSTYEMGPQHSQPASNTRIRTSHVIGGGDALPSQPRTVERMVGVQDHGSKMPLVVLDGANVAHAYTDAMASMNATYKQKRGQYRNGKPDPDARGIQVATDYFLSAGSRVLVVLPQYWLRKKPRPGDTSSHNAMMETAQSDILNHLNDQGLIVSSPPADDDDAYALTIAKREERRALRQRDGEGPGFVLSNDMFRDAQARDSNGILEQWLNKGRDESIGPGRISYTFCDMGTMDDHGDRILDFVPNPRHAFVIFVEGLHHQALANR